MYAGMDVVLLCLCMECEMVCQVGVCVCLCVNAFSNDRLQKSPVHGQPE